MSRAAAALLRSLLARAAIDADRILLSEVRSVDWQSLTFTGEQHELLFHLAGPGAEDAYIRLTHDLDEAEFALCGLFVADIRAERRGGGEQSIFVAIEALTVEE